MFCNFIQFLGEPMKLLYLKVLKLMWLYVAEAAAFQRFHNISDVNSPLYLGNSLADLCHCRQLQ